MNKHYLHSQLKSSGAAYLCWFFLGCQYAYLGKWGLQFLYWFTLGGIGIWCFIDLFHIPTKVNNHNRLISHQILEIENKEKADMHAQQMALINAAKNS